MTKKFRISTFPVMLIVVFCMLYSSCKKDEEEPEAIVPTSVKLISGGDQTAIVEMDLANPVVIQVQDQYGNPCAGTTVSFVTSDGSLSAEKGTTDEDGKASVIWTLGATVGKQTLTVTAFKADGTTALTGLPLTVTGTGEAAPLVVGDFAEGGVVFYLFVNGDYGYVEGETHGLVCAVSDQNGGSGVAWIEGGNTQFTKIGTTLQGIGSGQANTDAMMNQVGYIGGAAKICDDLIVDGKDDWFLPSRDELYEMGENKDVINTTAVANGGTSFANSYYWSSTESNGSEQFVWSQHFKYGFDSIRKDRSYRVRAVRAF